MHNPELKFSVLHCIVETSVITWTIVRHMEQLNNLSKAVREAKGTVNLILI